MIEEPGTITSLFRRDGSLNNTFCILECPNGDWKWFDATIDNIKKILDGKHNFFGRTNLSEAEKKYLREGLRQLEITEPKENSNLECDLVQ